MVTDSRARRRKTPLQLAVAASRPALVSAIVFSFFANILMFVGPIYMMQVYDRVLSSRNEMTLLFLTLIVAGLLIAYAGLEMFRSRVLVRGGIKFDEVASEPTFNAVQNGTLRHPGASQSQALRDLDTVREFYTGQGLIAFCDIPWMPLFVIVCWLLHPWFGYLAIGGALIILALTFANEQVTRNELGEAGNHAMIANRFAQSSFRNAEVVHAMGMMPVLRRMWSESHGNVLNWQAIASDRAGILMAATKFTRMFIQSLALGMGAYLAIKNEITPGAMIAATIIIARALAPIEQAIGQWKFFLACRVAYGRLQSLFENVAADEDKIKLPDPSGRLSLEGVTAAPPGSKQIVLRNLSFTIPAGETVAVVGPSAAGKSSLARLLVGVWQPVAGQVRLDGADLRHWDPIQLGNHMGYLPQDVELFSGTIAENISRFNDGDEELVIEAAKLAGVHDMIQGLSGGYNTQIGDGGHALSGGQRQRIGLARALYGNPALVVLDEPNASLDQDGEQALVEAIQKTRSKRRTIVLVTHKANILAVADKILVLNQGQLMLFGPRDEVLQKMMSPRVVPSQAAPGSTSPLPQQAAAG